MSIENLVIGLMSVYFFCVYFIVFNFVRLVFPQGYGFKIGWYHKAAGTYVLALPIFIFLVYLIGELA